MTPEETTALINLLTLFLTQLGIPGVFLFAWYWERRKHEITVRNYLRDLRRAAGLTIPEDVLLQSESSGGGGD